MENKLRELKRNLVQLRVKMIHIRDIEELHTLAIFEFKKLIKQVTELENLKFQEKLFEEKSIERIVRRHDKQGKQGVIVFNGDWINKMVKITEVRE